MSGESLRPGWRRDSSLLSVTRTVRLPTSSWSAGSSQPVGVIAVSAKRTRKRSKAAEVTTRGRADLARLRMVREADIARTSPPELATLPEDFWDAAELVMPAVKQAISLRVDEDVLTWFRSLGPRYQTRMNAVLRAYMTQAAPGRGSRVRRGA